MKKLYVVGVGGAGSDAETKTKEIDVATKRLNRVFGLQIAIVLADKGVAGIDTALTAPALVIMGNDPVAIAKVAIDFGKVAKKGDIIPSKGGYWLMVETGLPSWVAA